MRKVFLGLLIIIIALTATQVELVDKRLYVSLKGLGASAHKILIATLVEARFGLMTAAMTVYGRIITEIGISMMVGENIKFTRTITTAIALETEGWVCYWNCFRFSFICSCTDG